ncbi:MAG: PolC-type DNA polymerase III [Clostridiales bacterium]|jgi:DNA polymerase-3 subunit alpha (Gram-positive type)|nr:PolC-type DNA polymerase III [Clostridiales bacterium]
MAEFADVFKRVNLSPSLRKSLSRVEINGVRVDARGARMYVGLTTHELIREYVITLFRRELIEQFGIKQVLIDVRYVDPNTDLNKRMEAIWENILGCCESVVCLSVLKTARWSLDGNKLLVHVGKNSSYLLTFKGIDKVIQKYISDNLASPFIVEFVEDLEIKSKRLSVREDYKAASVYAAPASAPVKNTAAAKRASHDSEPVRGRSRLKINNHISGAARLLSDDIPPNEEMVIKGEIISIDARDIKSGRMLISFDITDGTGSITVKFFTIPDEFRNEYGSVVKLSNYVTLKGKSQYDEFAKEVVIMVSEIGPAERAVGRMDNALEKRVELHLHTQMSSMDAVTPAKTYINRAIEWGHPAIAITDHGVAQSFPEAMDAAKGKDIKVIYGIEAYLVDDFGDLPDDFDPKKTKYYHAVILAKNAAGLRNLYKLISESHLNNFYRRPRVLKSQYIENREGLIIGTACEAGEFFKAVLNNAPDERIAELAEFYDYFEIQPIGNNMYLLRDGKVSSVQDLIDINKRIVELGEIYGKPVIATCDTHFIDPEDEVFRRIIMAGEGFKDADRQPPLFFRTTEEMLAEFDYLGHEKAYEVVITNPRLIADQIDKLKPIPDETFPPQIEGAEEQIKEMTLRRAHELYGDNLPEIVSGRLDRELNSIIKNGFSVMYIIAQKLVRRSNDDGYLVGSRGSVGSSLAATMAGITEVNPLPAHYLCPSCKYSEFTDAGGSGCDLPAKNCPVCGKPLSGEGHDIPFETFLGFDGDKEPDIDLNFSGEYQARAHAYTEELFGSGNVFKAGTIATLADKTAYGYVRKYFEERGITPRKAEINRLKLGCTGIKRTTGQHPGGLMILPRGHSIYEFCPVQRPANDTASEVTTTHFDYHSISGRLLKLDLLGHDVPTIIRMLQDITGVDPVTVPLNDKKVMSLFTSPQALDVTPEEINCNTGTLGLPEFGTSFVRQMLMDTKPSTFTELINISGLSHGTNVWLNNAADLVHDKTATLKDVISTRDDIMLYLIHKGVEKKAAFKIMESVRKGKGLKPEEIALMEDASVPEWYINSCQKIKYLFPKGHAVAYVTMTVRIGYFKVYYPYSFYAASFSVKAKDFDLEQMCFGKERLKRAMSELIELGKEASAKDENKLTIMELVLEMYCRGLKFAPLDLYKAQAGKFTVTPQGLMPPLCSVQGLGMSVAQNIVDAREQGEFFTVDDFRERTKTNKTVVELLKRNGILDGIPESSQLSLF